MRRDPDADADGGKDAPLSADELRQLQRRSDARGLARLAGHLAAMGGAGALYASSIERSAPIGLVLLLAAAFGFTLVTMFAAMHESVHRTAFETRALNDAVAWFAGLLSFYNSTFYRYYHGWHHRFTQLEGKDPELEDGKPKTFGAYFLELSGVPWWLGKLKTHLRIASGRTHGYGFLNATTRPEVVRSVRCQLLVYAAAIGASIAAGQALFVTYWLVPVAVAQPLLRAILLAEHTGCSEDANPLTNTRTTYTLFPVRFLMWDMPYHAEHHRYPALPFFALAETHARLGPRLTHVAKRGYLGMHLDFLRGLGARARNPGIHSGGRH